jgi:hypothetical protein
VSAIPPNPKRESQKNLEEIRAYVVEDAENRISWPSLFVVGRDGNVSWRSIAQTYKVRAAPAQILQALDALPPTAD